MYLFTVLLALYTTNFVYGYPPNTIPNGYKILEPEEMTLLDEWTEDSKQNKWELSGQVEGDMIISPEQTNGLLDDYYRWPNKELPYIIDSMFTIEETEHLVAMINILNSSSCVNVRPALETDTDVVTIMGYLRGCVANVGYRGGMQYINLEPDEIGKGCFSNGNILHEFLHTLGFVHMHSDSDRDEYVTINWDNIKPRKKYNFVKYNDTTVTKFGITYDYDSLMHYSAYAFSLNNETTIVPKNESASIGHKDTLSESDIKKLNLMYNCP